MYITKEYKDKEGHKFLKNNSIYTIKENGLQEPDEYHTKYTFNLKIVRRIK